VTTAINVILIDVSVAVLPQHVYPVSTASLWFGVGQRQSWSNNTQHVLLQVGLVNVYFLVLNFKYHMDRV